jgi:hypothetical protein
MILAFFLLSPVCIKTAFCLCPNMNLRLVCLVFCYLVPCWRVTLSMSQVIFQYAQRFNDRLYSYNSQFCICFHITKSCNDIKKKETQDVPELYDDSGSLGRNEICVKIIRPTGIIQFLLKGQNCIFSEDRSRFCNKEMCSKQRAFNHVSKCLQFGIWQDI